MTSCPALYYLDEKHAFEVSRPERVCANTAAMLAETRYFMWIFTVFFLNFKRQNFSLFKKKRNFFETFFQPFCDFCDFFDFLGLALGYLGLA
jgi:hypothetical protein